MLMYFFKCLDQDYETILFILNVCHVVLEVLVHLSVGKLEILPGSYLCR